MEDTFRVKQRESPSKETNRVSRTPNASEAFGRERGSPSQQRCINIHKFPVKLGCAGRSGRDPWIIDNGTIQYGSSLNGITPVKTCVDTSNC